MRDASDASLRRRHGGGRRVVHPAQGTPQTAAMLDELAGRTALEVPALWP